MKKNVFNADHYSNVLTAGYYEKHEPRVFELCGLQIEVFPPTVFRCSWLVVESIFDKPQIMTLEEVSEYLAGLYAEEHRKRS